jgi:hypothetical protein
MRWTALPFFRKLSRCRARVDHGDRSYRPLSLQPNPIYLAFSLLQIGIAFWINSLWLLATLLGAMA